MADLSEREKSDRLKWHVPDNLRWLADQSDRPAYVPCGELTGRFLILVAEQYEKWPERLAAARNEAREECARLVDSKNVHGLGNTAYDNAYDDATKDIAAAIRSLKEPQ